MLPSPESVASEPKTTPRRRVDYRLIAAVLLLVPAIALTWRTGEGLAERRRLHMQLAEISHVKYGMLNADRWLEKIVPILNAQIDSLDLKAGEASLRPMVQNALYRLLDQVKAKMSAPPAQPATGFGALFSQGNPLIANMIVDKLKPQVPEYANLVLAELGKRENQEAVKKYVRGVLADGARTTFGNVDMQVHNAILKEHGCANAADCQAALASLIHEADGRILRDCLTVLAASALAFALLLTGAPVLRRPATIVLMIFCAVLLLGGIFNPMLEVEAKITHFNLSFLGTPVSFSDQVLYFQSKSVLEVFRTLVTQGRPDMWIVGMLVLMFSVVFPTLKIFACAFGLYRPRLLRENRVIRFFALESSKWSMADVMALAIFMSFVAFNGLIMNTMGILRQTGADLTIPTDSSRLLAGYYLFIGFCLASLFLAKKLARGIDITKDAPAK
jgi:hypothetical protein